MNAYLAVAGGALILLAVIGLLIWLLIREARAAQAAKDATQIRDQTIAKKQADIIAEHRDPDPETRWPRSTLGSRPADRRRTPRLPDRRRLKLLSVRLWIWLWKCRHSGFLVDRLFGMFLFCSHGVKGAKTSFSATLARRAS